MQRRQRAQQFLQQRRHAAAHLRDYLRPHRRQSCQRAEPALRRSRYRCAEGRLPAHRSVLEPDARSVRRRPQRRRRRRSPGTRLCAGARRPAGRHRGRLEGGYRFGMPYGGIPPYAAIQAQNFHTPGYTETGLIPNGFALSFNGRDATDTRSELGARLDRVLAVYTNAVLALRGRVAWAHDWVSDATLV